MIEIPGYSIIRTLGKGGMAEVYLAIQQSFEREVALKILAPHLAGDSTFSERFLREAKIVSRLVHPNIVTVYDVGIEGEHHFLSMEYIPGQDLKQARDELSLAERIEVVKDIARALQFAGKKGYVHRDVKPENIMLHAEDGRAVLMDFGIARPSDMHTGMTQTGTAIGTPHYMSPEQARGQEVDPRSDLYSLGVVLFLLLAGHVPFDADSAVAVGIKHVAEPIPLLPSELQVFQSIINKALSKDPQHRYQTGGEFVSALEAISKAELDQIEQRVERSNQRQQVEAASLDPEAPTVISAAVSDDFTPVSVADDERDLSNNTASVAEVEPTSEATVVEPLSQQHQSSRWPWVAGLLLAGGLGYLVYFQQQLPVHQRTQVVEAMIERGEQQLERWLQSDEVDLAEREISKVAVDDGAVGAVDTNARADRGSPLVAQASTSESLPSSTLANDETLVGEAIPGVNQAMALRSQQLVDAERWLLELPKDLELGASIADVYRALLGKNPTDIEARQGLQRVRDVYEQQAHQALAQRDYAAAESVLEQANDAFPLAATDPRFEKIHRLLRESQQIDQWLGDAKGYMSSNALTRPEGANALERYRRVLEVQPQHAEAGQGIATIVKRLMAAAQRRADRGEWSRAMQNMKVAFDAAPENVELQKLRVKLERRRQVRQWAQAAKRQRQQGDVFSPPGANALQSLRKILALEPNNREALTAVSALEDSLVSGVEVQIQRNEWDNARAQIARALSYFPSSSELRQLKAINEQAIWDDSQPRIEQLRISHQVIDGLLQPQLSSIPVTGLIHVGFEFENFGVETSLIQARLFEGQPAIEIAQLQVIVTRDRGQQYFRFDPPLQGFADGSYRMELWLDDQSLASSSFNVLKPVVPELN
jgi:serine/threonine-protein kinase PpkA